MNSRALFSLFLLLLIGSPSTGTAQESSPSDLKATIDRLGNLDYPTRMNAARTLRRVAAEQAVPLLINAVRANSDEYVRFRALVVLSGFNDSGTPQLMRGLLKDRNDRLREVAYSWFAQHPDPALTTTMLGALQTEQAEFVRPALVRALAALTSDSQVQRALLSEAGRGLDFFRSAVLEALGDAGAKYAFDTIAPMAVTDGPLQDDAVLALGRIGDPRASAVLGKIVQPSREVVPALHAARCLLGEDCPGHVAALSEIVKRRDVPPEDLRNAISALTALATRGTQAATALGALLLAPAGAPDTVRDQVALGVATVALKNPDYALRVLAALPDDRRGEMLTLMQDGFAMLEDDFAEEQFFAAVRGSYWKADEGSPTRALTATLIEKLEF